MRNSKYKQLLAMLLCTILLVSQTGTTVFAEGNAISESQTQDNAPALSETRGEVDKYTHKDGDIRTASGSDASGGNTNQAEETEIPNNTDSPDISDENENFDKIILNWSWAGANDENPVLKDEAGFWEMHIPSINTGNILSLDDVASMLPSQITVSLVHTATGSNVEKTGKIALEGWHCDEFAQDAQGAWPVQGEYIFEAVLPEGYLLSENARPLEIKVAFENQALLALPKKGDLTVTGGIENTDYEYADNTLTVKSNTPITVRGTTTGDRIVVDSSCTGSNAADITLDGVTIKSSDFSPFEVMGSAECSLNITGKNTLESGSVKSGLRVPLNASLTIQGVGTLHVKGNLGGGNGNEGRWSGNNSDRTGGNGEAAGTVSIISGTVTIDGNLGGGNGGNALDYNKQDTNNNYGPTDGGAGGIVESVEIRGGVIKVFGNLGGGNGGGASWHNVDNGNGTGGAGGAGSVEISGGSITAGGCLGGGNGGNGGHSKANSWMTAQGNGGAGGNGTVTITGGYVVGVNSMMGGGIGGQRGHGANEGKAHNGADGSATCSLSGGTAVVQIKKLVGVDPAGSGWSGILMEGIQGTVYGSSVTPYESFNVPENTVLTIGSGQTLTVKNGITLTNRGTININSDGALINQGTIKNYGTINGTVSGGSAQEPSRVTVALAKKGEAGAITSADYGDVITITAKVSKQAASNALLRSANVDTVDFWLGGIGTGTKLNPSPVSVNDSIAALDVKLDGELWMPRENPVTITADFGGMSGLIENTGTAALKIHKAGQIPSGVTVNAVDVTYGTPPVITPLVVADHAQVSYFAVSNTNGSDDSTDVAGIEDTNITLYKTGSFYVKAVIDSTDYYRAKTVYSPKITVSPAASAFTAVLKNGSTDTNQFVYGDTVTVEISNIQIQQSRSNTLEQNYVYLFASDPADSPDTSKAIDRKAVNGGTAALTYDSKGKAIASGNQQLWVSYGGNGNLKMSTQTVSIHLAAKPLTGAVDSGDSSAEKIYDGNTDLANVKLTLTGAESGDEVTAVATGTSADANVGSSIRFQTASTSLSGRDASWYSLAPEDVGGTVKITKAAGAPISGSVTGSYTGEGSAFTYTVSPITGAEYSKDNSTWQESNVFTQFAAGSVSTFYARMKADKNHTAGPASSTAEVTFSKLERTGLPNLAFEISGATGSKKITITAVTGCEYTFDNGESWGSANEQTFTTDGKPVIGIRYGETAIYKASAGAMQTVDLKNLEQEAPEAFTLTFTDNGNATFTAEIPAVQGGEYSFDGTSWSGTNTKTDCHPNTAYTGYVRFAARDGYNASPVTSDTETTPGRIAADPVITPNGGIFMGSQRVTISTATPNASIHYTVDGAIPFEASPVYTGPFTLTDSTTVQAIALRDGYEDSPVITAVFTRLSSGGSSDSSDSGSDQSGAATPPSPNTVVTETIFAGGPDHSSSVTVSSGQVESAVNAARKNPVAIAVNLPAWVSRITLDRAALDRLISSRVKSFILNFDGVSLTFDRPVLKELAEKTTGALTFGADKASGLTGNALAVIAGRPAYDITVAGEKNGELAAITDFGAGRIGLALAYTPDKSERTGGLYLVRAEQKGDVTWLYSSSYEVGTKLLIGSIAVPGVYGAGYQAPPAFRPLPTMPPMRSGRRTKTL